MIKYVAYFSMDWGIVFDAVSPISNKSETCFAYRIETSLRQTKD